MRWPFMSRQRVTEFYDPKINAIQDPAVREWVSRLQGRCDQLDREVRWLTNIAEELRERSRWSVPVDGSPFAEGDKIAREIVAASTGGSIRPVASDPHSEG